MIVTCSSHVVRSAHLVCTGSWKLRLFCHLPDTFSHSGHTVKKCCRNHNKIHCSCFCAAQKEKIVVAYTMHLPNGH